MAKSEGVEEGKDWSELPSELIHVIAKKLPDIVDFIHFRSVCKAWRSSAPVSDPPYQLPWFLELFERDYLHTTLRRRQQYYSVCSGEILTIPFTNRKLKLNNWIQRGVCGHYLAFADQNERTVSFFNPLTADLFSPPSPQLRWGICNLSTVWTGMDPIRNRTILVLNHDILLQIDFGGWALYNPHNNEWVEQKGFFKSSCYWQGMFFSTHAHGPTEVFDASTKQLLHTIPPPEDESLNSPDDSNDLARLLSESYLVLSSEMILRVLWFYDNEILETVEDSLFHIYRLVDYDRACGKPYWVRITDIGDQILFLEEMNGFSMTARPSTGFRQGCIYFIDPFDNTPYVHDLSAGTVESVPCPFNKCTWFLPGV
ncbi:hypothetical protein LUZ61_000178 [Rhynchospora tenuis]|uniref:F-box domain-containing protein n=1 Tax=Rhynchospora tenuis TaxID=198213 RepID=A0AAD5ZEW1_9POAL|nr:hypothetical protein LUZ61_000178 [Rhynchospora tenuis]